VQLGGAHAFEPAQFDGWFDGWSHTRHRLSDNRIMQTCRTLTQSVDAEWRAVYDFVIDPNNLPRWAPNFARSVSESSDGWSVETDTGTVGIRFEPINDLGVADHWVTIEPGVEIHNAVRVIANGRGAEVTFTFFQTPDLNDDDFAGAADLVTADLAMLRTLLER
jgi:hypothetical protein